MPHKKGVDRVYHVKGAETNETVAMTDGTAGRTGEVLVPP